MPSIKIFDDELCLIVHYKTIPWQVIRDACKRHPTQVYYQEFYPEGTRGQMSNGELVRHFVSSKETEIFCMKGDDDHGETQSER